ncbi:MAG TPA: pseudaminic acid synthase [Ideonella sp.]|nr:pseudaminic acid synthase [Ideonella sp.]
MNAPASFFAARRGEPFVIAEMSGNHNQSLDRAMEIVEAAARAGAHALKIQTFTPDTMTLDLKHGEFVISDPKSPWRGEAVYELYKKAQTPWEWHAPLFARARELGMLGFSSPFDETAVDFLQSLDVPLYKIASFENTDLPLIRKVAATGKPVIMSTGMATAGELELSVRAAREAGCTDLTLLKCTSTYPASPENTHLRTIPHMRELYGCPVGLSDHTLGVGAAVAAVALGAPVIEKHLTLARADGGVDSSFSLEPDEFAQLVRETRTAWLAMGSVHYGPTQAESVAVTRRRSVYVVRPVKAGETVTRDNIRCIRPGHGLPPRHFDALLGRKFRRDAPAGAPMAWDLLD